MAFDTVRMNLDHVGELGGKEASRVVEAVAVSRIVKRFGKIKF